MNFSKQPCSNLLKGGSGKTGILIRLFLFKTLLEEKIE